MEINLNTGRLVMGNTENWSWGIVVVPFSIQHTVDAKYSIGLLTTSNKNGKQAIVWQQTAFSHITEWIKVLPEDKEEKEWVGGQNILFYT